MHNNNGVNFIMYMGRRLKVLREERGFSRKELAEGVVSYSYLSNIENGVVNCSSDTLIFLANKLKVPIDFFTKINKPDETIEIQFNKSVKLLKENNLEELKKIIYCLKKSNLYNINQEIKFTLLASLFYFKTYSFNEALIHHKKFLKLTSPEYINKSDIFTRSLNKLVKYHLFILKKTPEKALELLKDEDCLFLISNYELEYLKAVCYKLLGYYSVAKNVLIRGLELCPEKFVAEFINLIAIIEYTNGNKKDTLRFLFRAHYLSKRTHDDIFQSIILNNLSIISFEFNKNKLSRYLASVAINVREKHKIYLTMNPYLNFIDISIKEENYQTAFKLINSMDKSNFIGDKNLILSAYKLNLMRITKSTPIDFEEKVKKLFIKAKRTNKLDRIPSFCYDFSLYFFERGRYKDAFEFLYYSQNTHSNVSLSRSNNRLEHSISLC